MRKEVKILFLLSVLLILPLVLAQEKQMQSDDYGGPTSEEIKCLENCMGIGCDEGDIGCIEANSGKCEQECGVEPEPSGELDKGEQCVQDCIDRDCDRGPDYVKCIESARGFCDKECGMIGEPEAQSEEEQCMRDCINAIDPNIECSHGTFEGEGETGNKACRKCANECSHLYSGPCLNDKEWTEKENVCTAQCEHCYGEPIRGPSGQGWDCTIDIKCADASAEFGDDAGTGDNNWEEGHAPSDDNVYWGDYKSNLEVSNSKGTLSIRNTNIENVGRKFEVEISIDEDVSLEQRDKKLIVKNKEVEIEVNNNIDSLIISKKGNKKNIKNIDVGIEEGKPVYRYEEKERAKLLGFIPINKDVQKKVDAENMDILEEEGPWWEFLSVEEKEKSQKDKF